MVKGGRYTMIECEFKCIKEHGSPADIRVDSEMIPENINVCWTCYDILASMGNITIVEVDDYND